MQTVWSRATQVRSSCRCPSCTFSNRAAPRRRSLASVAQHVCSSTTGFAVTFSTAVASASYLDVRAKQKRRDVLDQSLAETRAQVQELVEGQEARLRALREKLNYDRAFGIGGIVNKWTQSHNGSHKSSRGSSRPSHAPTALQNGYIRLQIGTSSHDGPDGRSRAKPANADRAEDAETYRTSSNPHLHALLDSNKRLLSTHSRRNLEQEHRGHYHGDTHQLDSHSTDTGDQELWSTSLAPPTGLRASLQMTIHMSRLILQLDYLGQYLRIRTKHYPQDSNKPHTPSSIPSTEPGEIAHSLERLEVMSTALNHTRWERHDEEREGAGLLSVYDSLAAEELVRVYYMWDRSARSREAGVARQEDQLLEFFSRSGDSHLILSRLSDFLAHNDFAPSIHMFNIMIVGLCDHGLPCAARLVLECVRRCPVDANAITHEAALRCALLDRDRRFFETYYSHLKCQNASSWHSGQRTSRSVHQPMLLARSKKRLIFDYKTAWYRGYPATFTNACTEVIIRYYLRINNLQRALHKCYQLLKRGRCPSIHLLESFLRAAYLNGEVDIGWRLWQQFKIVHNKPPPAAYYWILSLLALPPRSADSTKLLRRKRSNKASFDHVAQEMADCYALPHTFVYETFSSQKIDQRVLYRISAEIEDLRFPQWVPGRSTTDRMATADLPEAQASEAHASWPSNLERYLRLQHSQLKQHVIFNGPIWTSYNTQDFFRELNHSSSATDTSLPHPITASLPSREAMARGATSTNRTESNPDDEWEDIEDLEQNPSLPAPLPPTPPALLGASSPQIPPTPASSIIETYLPGPASWEDGQFEDIAPAYA